MGPHSIPMTFATEVLASTSWRARCKAGISGSADSLGFGGFHGIFLSDAMVIYPDFMVIHGDLQLISWES